MMNDDVSKLGKSKKLSLLSSSVLKYYFRELRNGDKSFRSILIESNQGLIKNTINRHFRSALSGYYSFDYNDLFSIGMIGLIKAVDTFDVDRGTEFSTCASTYIYNEIGSVIRKTRHGKYEISMQDTIAADPNADDMTYEDVLVSNNDIEQEYVEKEEYQRIRTLIKTLEPREQMIMLLHNGFNGIPMSYENISQILKVSRARVAMIDKMARVKLKRRLNH